MHDGCDSDLTCESGMLCAMVILVPYKDPMKARDTAKKRQRSWRKNHPDLERKRRNSPARKAFMYVWMAKHPNRHLAERAGHDAVIYREKQKIAQDGRCAICNRKEIELKHRLGLDHDHRFNLRDSKGWRGLLCGECNSGIGHFRENPELFLRAMAYLEFWSEERN